MWGAAHLICDGLCSDDGFWYFQCWLIGLGRETFERVAADPDALAGLPLVHDLVSRGPNSWADDEWPDWESLDFVAGAAYERVTGLPEGLEEATRARRGTGCDASRSRPTTSRTTRIATSCAGGCRDCWRSSGRDRVFSPIRARRRRVTNRFPSPPRSPRRSRPTGRGIEGGT